jgi:hypothetical protein
VKIARDFHAKRVKYFTHGGAKLEIHGNCDAGGDGIWRALRKSQIGLTVGAVRVKIAHRLPNEPNHYEQNPQA